MASTNKTAHYSLNLWEPGDQVLRTDFNADNSKIDAAILGARPVFGMYTGDGKAVEGKAVTLGFRPAAVVISTKHTPGEGYSTGVMAMAVDGIDNGWVSITANGFLATQSMNNNATLSNPYRYIAWR